MWKDTGYLLDIGNSFLALQLSSRYVNLPLARQIYKDRLFIFKDKYEFISLTTYIEAHILAGNYKYLKDILSKITHLKIFKRLYSNIHTFSYLAYDVAKNKDILNQLYMALLDPQNIKLTIESENISDLKLFINEEHVFYPSSLWALLLKSYDMINLKEAITLFEYMMKNQLIKSIGVVNFMIDLCLKYFKYNYIFSVYNRLETIGISSDEKTYQYMIESYHAIEKYQEAYEYLKKLKDIEKLSTLDDLLFKKLLKMTLDNFDYEYYLKIKSLK